MRKFLTCVVAGFALGSCQTPSHRTGSGVVNTHAEMVGAINPASLAVAELLDKARSETEGLDPGVMDDAAWARMLSAARSLEASSRRMAEARSLRADAHTAEEPGFASRDEIQARIDADPESFRQLSRRMAEHSGELAAAAAARNLRRTRDLAESLNGSCQSCHTRYWENPRS